jgi:hypothetical protein
VREAALAQGALVGMNAVLFEALPVVAGVVAGRDQQSKRTRGANAGAHGRGDAVMEVVMPLGVRRQAALETGTLCLGS